jgi:anion-transporting  ArsA/GET3 family ATPase
VSLGELLGRHRIILCAGPGGVGKTTTSAALALAAARLGRRALVVTIDPAKRLVTSLGLGSLDHLPRPIPLPSPASGALFAMMLDQKRSFDELVERHVRDAGLRARIYANRIYQQLSTVLSGAHEYAAMATLWELDQQRAYDLIVLDTPPTQNALGFLDAPERMIGALDSAALQWFLAPYEGQRATWRSLRLLGAGGAFVLKRLARFVGSSFLDDIARFFVEFRDLLEVFRRRAQDVQRLLRDPGVEILLVSAPDAHTVAETVAFREQLRQRGMPLGGVVFNRVRPTLGPMPPSAEVARQLARVPATSALSPALLDAAAEALVANAEELERAASAERALIDGAVARCGPEHLYVEVPAFPSDVHDLRGLLDVVSHLMAPARR